MIGFGGVFTVTRVDEAKHAFNARSVVPIASIAVLAAAFPVLALVVVQFVALGLKMALQNA